MSEETMEDMDVDATMGDNVKDGEERKRGRVFYKRKICRFCSQKLVVNYKDPSYLRRFVTERGKILPRRITGTCAKHQRMLTTEIKRARALALLPFVTNDSGF